MTQELLRYVLPLAVGVLMSATVHAADAQELLVFISAFDANQGGLYACKLNVDTGRLEVIHRTQDARQPFFLALSPDRKFLYCTHAPDHFGGKENEQVAAYEIVGSEGELRLLNRVSSLGTSTCYVDVDATGKTVVAANYSTGSVAAFPVRSDGSLG
ncbi:MAG: lactonase family protein, partial [Isosphaeraceae bacterium]